MTEQNRNLYLTTDGKAVELAESPQMKAVMQIIKQNEKILDWLLREFDEVTGSVELVNKWTVDESIELQTGRADD